MIKIYYSTIRELDSKEVWKACYESLHESHKESVQKRKNKQDQKCTLAAGWLLTYALSKEGINRYEIAVKSGGKPYLKDSPFFFNLSHSGDYVACVLADIEVGIDVQKLEAEAKAMKIAKRFFLLQEYEELRSLEGREREHLFAKFWTLKEAYVKLTGEGLSGGLSSVMIDAKNQCVCELEPGQIKGYFVTEELVGGYHISVMAKQPFLEKAVIHKINLADELKARCDIS